MSSVPVFPSSATVRTREKLVLKGGAWRPCDLAVRYGVFDHPAAGRCLIDTGYSPRVTTGKRGFFLRTYAGILRPQLSPQALPKAEPKVDMILLTHLHADHVSALRDYPDARIIVRSDAARDFMSSGAFHRIKHGVFRELLPEDFLVRLEPLEDMARVQAPFGLGRGYDVFGDGSVLGVDLPGHMHGHVGYVWPKLETPLLYAADAQWLMRAIAEERMPGPPARWIFHDVKAAIESGRRIAAFAKAGGRVVLCHDPEAP